VETADFRKTGRLKLGFCGQYSCKFRSLGQKVAADGTADLFAGTAELSRGLDPNCKCDEAALAAGAVAEAAGPRRPDSR
jgi:hypothetical protein